MHSKSFVIISNTDVQRDPRVYKQVVEALKFWNVLLLGASSEAPDVPKSVNTLEYRKIPSSPKSITRYIVRKIGSIFSYIISDSALWFNSFSPSVKGGANLIREIDAVAILANELDGLEMAVTGRARKSIPIIFDAHEYYPHQSCKIVDMLFERRSSYVALKKRIPCVASCITVCEPIAKRYDENFRSNFHVVRNIPIAKRDASDHKIDENNIRLIHHGAAMRGRKLDVMIRAVAKAEKRWKLDMMLVGDVSYIEELRSLASKLAPGRINFVSPVPTQQIVSKIRSYDAGIYSIAPTCYNNLMSLPNKFFEFVAAGLPTFVGPSPVMAKLAKNYKFGMVAEDFTPDSMAQLLDSVSIEALYTMREAAEEAYNDLNGEREMKHASSIWKQTISEVY